MVKDLQYGGYDKVVNHKMTAWESGYSYTYDANGNAIDSTYHAPNQTYINHYEQENILLRKFITPYGNYIDLGADGFTWVFDVTNFQTLLRDSIDLSGGVYWGVMDHKFEFIEGIPPRNVVDVHSVGNIAGKYEDIVATPADFVRELYPHPNGNTFVLEGSFSGHGFNNTPNCSEFCPRTHFIEVDGVQHSSWTHWKECADNALFPQGGTWIYDRTGWCPGAGQDLYTFDITNMVTPGDTHTVFKGVVADPTGTEYGNWGGYMHLFSYSPANFSLDAELYDIISPSVKDEYLRFNPTCGDIIVKIRNSGSTTLTSLVIHYGVMGGQQETFNWTGSLEFLETEEVVLPISGVNFWAGDGSNRFVAAVSNPNGQTDQHNQNDQMQSSYEHPYSNTGGVRLRVTSNNYGNQNAYTVKDLAGNVIISRGPLMNNTIYMDTITQPGCYTFEITDTDDDGLSFWANTAQGSGSIQMWHATLPFNLKTLESDFGKRLRYTFTVDMGLNTNPLESVESFSQVFPNPNKGVFNVELHNITGEVHLKIFNAMGQELVTRKVNSSGSSIEEFELANYPAGIYFVKIASKTKEEIHKVMITE